MGKRPEGDGDFIDPPGGRQFDPQRIAASKFGMVATARWEATRAGVEMLEAGGNAMDAAVASAFALTVVEPQACGIGGQSMMLVHQAEPRKSIALDGSSRAPNRATADDLDRKSSKQGYRATTVPSTPAVLDYALRRFGSLPLARVLEPAIRLARHGFFVSDLLQGLLRRERKKLTGLPAGEVFLRGGRRVPGIGSTIEQPALARTLSRIARKGVDDFYRGAIAKKIHSDMRRNGGFLQLDDLAQIPTPIERRPIGCTFDRYRIRTMPPPGAGRTLIEMLNVYAALPPRLRDLDTPKGALALAAVIGQANRDRQDRPFNANTYPQRLTRRMVSPDHAKQIAKQVNRSLRPSGETTHLSVMDRFGNAVSLTQSIERVFGSCAMSPELGFLYNNYMAAFEMEDINHPYYLRPNAAPWASVAPTLGFRGKRPWLAIGSPGSQRSTSAILQVLLRLQRQTPFDAVASPRLHCSVEDQVSLESARMRDDISVHLERKGYRLDRRGAYAFYLGSVQMVLRTRDGYIGVADPRRDGSAAGPVQ